MKKIIIISTIAIAITNFCFAQSEPILVEMKKENTNPDFYEAHLPFLCLTFASANSNFFADFGGSLKKGPFYVDADFRVAYVNGLEEFIYGIDEPKANSIYEYESPKFFIINGGFMFSMKETPTKVAFHLKDSYKTRYYTEVDGKKTSFLMANLGYKTGFDWMTCNGKDLIFDGTVPAGFTAPKPEEVRTMMNYSMLSVGVSMGSTGYWEADIEKFGHRRSSKFVRYYFNLLFMMSSEIDPVYFAQTPNVNFQSEVYSQYNLDNSPRSNIGACAGAATTVISRLGIGGSAEVGYYPGISGSFASHFGVNIKSTISFGKVTN